MILKGNHKSSQSVLNAAALKKAISKEIDHGWALSLTIESQPSITSTYIPVGALELIPLAPTGIYVEVLLG